MTRAPLSIDRIVVAAVSVADQLGLPGLSMRNVAKAAGVEAMSLYHHVDGKDALLDALAEHLYGLMACPKPGEAWRTAMTTRAISAREVLASHPWGLQLVDSRRSPGPHMLHYQESAIANLRGNGFSMRLTAHALSLLDSYVYGFVLTEQNLPIDPGEDVEAYLSQLALTEADYPHMVAFARTLVVGQDYEYGAEFVPGLELLLDGLEQRVVPGLGTVAL